ncbi:universal stress protein [Mycolicibacterium nivoides]|uniref:Universal stress protein n=1 Tax=Mycolicibacterium nivoides TaxID=2487344 RepID=A0ABW9LAT7_9MYCO
MATKPGQYGILVAVDGSPESDAAVRWAAREAVLRETPVTLMHVIAPAVVSWPVAAVEGSITEWREDNARHVIEQAHKTLLANIGDAESPAVRTEVKHAGIVPELLAAADEAQMVAVGSRGIGAVGRAILGSVSSGLIHHAPCPVAVVHANEGQAPDYGSPVLLGIDGSPASESATALAFDEASRRGAGLVALHAWSDVAVFPVLGMDWHQYEDEGGEVLGERLAGWQEQYPDVNVQRRVVCDLPARWLIEESRRAQLVIVGNRGRGGFAGMLLGSVSSAVARSADAPVIVVRP